MYDKLPRPATTPGARERARALLGAAGRRQNLFAQALNQAEATPAASPLGTAPSAAPDNTSLEHLVHHITQASDQDLVDTHQRLAQARKLAQGHMAADAELAAFMAAAYGEVPSQAAGSPRAAMVDVVDVVAHEVDQPGTGQTATASSTDTQRQVP